MEKGEEAALSVVPQPDAVEWDLPSDTFNAVVEALADALVAEYRRRNNHADNADNCGLRSKIN